MKAIWLIFTMLVSTYAMAEPEDEIKGQICVMALWDENESLRLIEMVEQIHEKFKHNPRVEILPAAKAIKLLGGSGYVGKQAVDLERLWGIYQQGYIQSYNFEYQQAIESLEKVIAELENAPDSPARWDLYELANIYLGISYFRSQNKQAALKAFQRVLRTRWSMNLSKKDYPPPIRKVWREAKDALTGFPKGSLSIETDPVGAQVDIDGLGMGQTPVSIQLPYGRYFVKIADPVSGTISRWIKVDRSTVQVRYKTHFEAAMALHLEYPAVKLPKGKVDLPSQWWPWLGSRLGVNYIVLVKEQMVSGSSSWSVSLVDLERSRVFREGWLEAAGPESKHMIADAADLADFLITGRSTQRVTPGSKVVGGDTQSAIQPGLKSRPVKIGSKSDLGKDLKADRRLEVSSSRDADPSSQTAGKRPFLRKWWPYALTGGVMLAVGIGGGTISKDFQSQADDSPVGPDKTSLQQRADTWGVISVVGYGLAAASVLTGIILYHTYEPATAQPKAALWLGDNALGLTFCGRF